MSIVMNLIGVLLVLGIVYILYEKGIIRHIRFPIVKRNFTFNHSSTKRKLKLQYGKYNGVSNYNFHVKPGESAELHYDVEVEEGALVLSLDVGKEKVFDKTFFESEKGKFTFTPTKSTYFVVVTGKHTKGSCSIQLDASEGVKELQ